MENGANETSSTPRPAGVMVRGMPTRGAIGQVARHPSAILLVVQLLGVLLYPYIQTGGVGAVLFEIFGALVLALAIWATRESPGPTWIAVTLAVAASGLSIADEIHPVPAMDAASSALHALFYFWAAGSLMVYMLADRTVTTDELYAVGATFTLVAWGFAYVFELVQLAQPGSFIAAVNPDQPRTWMELLFLSFTNLSSTGLSDVVPVTAQSRSVVMIEQLAGLGYVALFVSRLVGLTVAWQISHASNDGQTQT
jgi:Ion channel